MTSVGGYSSRARLRYTSRIHSASPRGNIQREIEGRSKFGRGSVGDSSSSNSSCFRAYGVRGESAKHPLFDTPLSTTWAELDTNLMLYSLFRCAIHANHIRLTLLIRPMKQIIRFRQSGEKE